MGHARRLKKFPSEGTLLLGQDASIDSEDSGEITHNKKRLAAQHDENSHRIERASEWLKHCKAVEKDRNEQSASNDSLIILGSDDLSSAFISDSRTNSWIDVKQNGSAEFPEEWQNTDACNLSDHSDFDRQEFPSEERATVSRIGSQLTFTLPPSMGISQRKRLLNNLSERVDAHEAIVLHGVPDFGKNENASEAWRRSFSATTAEMRDLPHPQVEQQTRSRMSLEESMPPIPKPVRVKSCKAPKANSCQNQQGAELCLRLNHARQTMSFVHSQAAKYSRLDQAEMDIWQALDTLGELTECDTTFLESPETEASISPLEHAFQTAEACRFAFPSEEWLHVVGLIHSLGRLLSHRKLGGEPSWAVCCETFPLGCSFDPQISYHHYFSVNPDRRRRQYSSSLGIYSPGTGLQSVYMSWSSSEYLYMCLLLNKTNLPAEALFIIRYQKFFSLNQSKAYKSLMNAEDKELFPWLQKFRDLSIHKNLELPGKLTGSDFREYYSKLLSRYIPAGSLRF